VKPARIWLPLLVLVSLAACGAEAPVARAPMGGPPASGAAGKPTPVEAAAQPSHAPLNDADDAHPLTRKLGRDCASAAADEAERKTVEPCGRSGHVALALMTRAERKLPCEAKDVAPRQTHSLSACIDGDQLWATSECMVCRSMLSGWTVTAWLPDLTEAQRKDLVTRLKLDLDPSTTHDTADWRHAIATAAGEAARHQQGQGLGY
jgi:hypothetical protein